MQEIVDQLRDTIRTAAANQTPLCIRGGGSKDFYGGILRGETLAVRAYSGIVDYEPTELVITARAGTPLCDIEAALRERGQMLAFEPPHFAAPLPLTLPTNLPSPSVPEGRRKSNAPSPLTPLPKGEGNDMLPSPSGRGTVGEGPAVATVGGCIAAGLSGPRRAYAGAVRDFVLGVRILDGKGNDLRFGGRVMKNVAGFDVSRLMAGSLGTLGVMLEVSLKVLPLPVAEATLRLTMTAPEAIASVNRWAGQPLPISATVWARDELRVRLSGAGAAVAAAVKKVGGECMPPEQADQYWRGIRDHTDAFFKTPQPLWRLSLKPTTPLSNLSGEQVIEWGGALRWIATDTDSSIVRAAAEAGGGHATLFRGGDKSAGVFHPLPPALKRIHRNLKHTFDPGGIFNPGRLYDWG